MVASMLFEMVVVGFESFLHLYHPPSYCSTSAFMTYSLMSKTFFAQSIWMGER